MSVSTMLDKVISIVEGTTPTTTLRGLPASFKFFPEASLENLPKSRGFFLRDFAIGHVPHIGRGLPKWTRVELGISIVYGSDLDRRAAVQARLEDHRAITARLLDSSLWDSASSGIHILGNETPGEGGSLFPATVDEVQGAVLLSLRFPVSFTA